jgi:hypothetical protein
MATDLILKSRNCLWVSSLNASVAFLIAAALSASFYGADLSSDSGSPKMPVPFLLLQQAVRYPVNIVRSVRGDKTKAG